LFVLLRRADSVEVIGAAICSRAAGAGARTIAAVLGRPVETVRGWLRRLAGRLDLVRGWFTAAAVGVAVDPGGDPGVGPGGVGVVPLPTGSAWADLVTAVESAAQAVACRFGAVPVPVWWAAGAMSSGRLLAPSWPFLARLATRMTSAC
jgi:NAD(P)-dependent dehydrogenase (short-subunit alcohol dehydrogenase family)